MFISKFLYLDLFSPCLCLFALPLTLLCSRFLAAMSHVDPGLDEPAQEAAQDVERNVYEEERKQAEAEEQDFLDPR